MRQVELRPGAQDRLPDDFDENSLRYVLKQLREVGAVEATDPKSLTTAFGLIYSVGDKPIKSAQIDAARERDTEVRQEVAGDKVTDAGLALNAVAEQSAQGKVDSTTLEVVQMTDRDEGATPVKGGVDAQIKVSRSAPQGRQTSRRRG